MKKIIIISFLTLLMFSTINAQPNLNIDSKYFNNISNMKYYSNLQHDRFITSLAAQKYSEGGKPTEDIYQYWSVDNNRWENSVRYTYEYAAGKTNVDYFPNLMTMSEWFWCNINLIWNKNADANYNWNADGTIQSWLQSDAYGVPQARRTWTYDVFGDGTHVVSNNIWNGSSWQENWRGNIINNQDGFPVQTEYFNCTNGNCNPSALWQYSYSTYSGCPDFVTYSQYVNTVYNAYDAIWQWRFNYVNSGCTADGVPFNREIHWPCTPNELGYYLSTDNGATWTFNSSEEYNINSDCRSETIEWKDAQGNSIFKATFWYSNTGGGKIKVGSVLDNSDVRLVRSESEYFDGSNWINSSRNWYSYEGIQMDSNEEITVPDEFSLDQNYPNPFNPSTTITFDLSEDTNVKISIYDMTGRLIRELVDQSMTVGSKTINWDGKDEMGNLVSGNVYFYNLQTGDYSQTKKMVLLR